MRAGRELDALVAEKVMGHKVLSHWEPGVVKHVIDENQCEIDVGHWPKPYSTDIAAAWEVVAELRRRDWFMGIAEALLPKGWGCVFTPLHEGDKIEDPNDTRPERVDARAATAPHAICLAALKAKGAL